MGVQRSTIVILISGAALAGLCVMGLPNSPIVHAQTKSPLATSTSNATPRTISMTSASGLESLVKMDEATTDLVKFVQPGVVKIISESGLRHDVQGRSLPGVGGEGSGVVY